MKNQGGILVLLAALCLVFCSRYRGDEMNVNLKAGKSESMTVTLPFDARFVGEYLYGGAHPDHPECGIWDPDNGEFWGLVINAGEGNATQLGHFTYYFEFCCNFMTGIYPGEYSTGYFVAANGDTLKIMAAGQVFEGRLDDHPDYVNSWWRDPWVISGGTGRFFGATGSGYTDDYNSDLDPYSHHHWTGTITLPRGKRQN